MNWVATHSILQVNKNFHNSQRPPIFLPSCFLDFVLEWIPSALTNTKFVHSPKPMTQPSICMSTCSWSYTGIWDLFRKYLKTRWMGCTITSALSGSGPPHAMVEADEVHMLLQKMPTAIWFASKDMLSPTYSPHGLGWIPLTLGLQGTPMTWPSTSSPGHKE